MLRYSREIAFSAAEVYARAAEARGAWDARLEALVVDSILREELDPSLASRMSALGWARCRPDPSWRDRTDRREARWTCCAEPHVTTNLMCSPGCTGHYLIALVGAVRPVTSRSTALRA